MAFGGSCTLGCCFVDAIESVLGSVWAWWGWRVRGRVRSLCSQLVRVLVVVQYGGYPERGCDRGTPLCIAPCISGYERPQRCDDMTIAATFAIRT